VNVVGANLLSSKAFIRATRCKLLYGFGFDDSSRVIRSDALRMGRPTSRVLVVFDVMPYAAPVGVLKVGSVLAHSCALRVNLFLVHTDVSCSFLLSLLYILCELCSLILVGPNGAISAVR
jgi:hypothetical protein